jgi:hypothetical protein
MVDANWHLVESQSSKAGDDRLVQMTQAPDAKPDKVSPEAAESCRQLAPRPQSTDAERRLLRALHVSRRGREALRSDDRLTYHWVVLETLMPLDEWRPHASGAAGDSLLSVVSWVIPPLLVRKSFLCRVGWELRRHLIGLTSPFSSDQLVLQEEVTAALRLAPAVGETVGLQDFLESLPVLLSALSDQRRPRLYERVQDVIDFYSKPAAALSRIDAYMAETREALARVYRARNRIVHDAASDGPLFAALSDFAKYASAIVLDEAVYAAERKLDLTGQMVLTEAKVEHLRAQLSCRRTIDLVNWVDEFAAEE